MLTFDHSRNLGSIFDDIGGFFEDVGGAIVDGVSAALSPVCDAVSHPLTQTGANVALSVPNPYSMAAGGATKVAGLLCSWAQSGGKTAAPQFPAGSVAAFDPSAGGYRVAIPMGSQVHGAGLGEFETITDTLEHWNINDLSEWPLYHRMTTSDRPYLAALAIIYAISRA